jgi:hypothetical protein
MTAITPLDPNRCWFCQFRNSSDAQICAYCCAVTPPTRIDEQKITYLTYTFGSRAEEFGCQKLNAGLINDAISVMQHQHTTPVIIRTGTNHMQAILIKGTNKEIRLSIKDVPVSVAVAPIAPAAAPAAADGESNLFTQFLEASRHILAGDADPKLGKILFHSNLT